MLKTNHQYIEDQPPATATLPAGSQAPREVRERLDDTHKPQGLTIIKARHDRSVMFADFGSMFGNVAGQSRGSKAIVNGLV